MEIRFNLDNKSMSGGAGYLTENDLMVLRRLKYLMPYRDAEVIQHDPVANAPGEGFLYHGSIVDWDIKQNEHGQNELVITIRL